MLSDLERVKAALRAGARPQMVFGMDSLTRRSLKPDTIVHGPDGDVLVCRPRITSNRTDAMILLPDNVKDSVAHRVCQRTKRGICK